MNIIPDTAKITAIIPAYNEANRITKVIRSTAPYVDEILVVDDGSSDHTFNVAKTEGVKIIRQNHAGYIVALKKGFSESKNEILVTIDADGEHPSSEIPNLIAPIFSGKADLVLGKRNKIPRLSERLITLLTNVKYKTEDACTGFRAIRRSLAIQLRLKGKCTCGTLIIEAQNLGARIVDVPITVSEIDKSRSISWHHCIHIINITAMLIKKT